ncbi:MAG: hypothetical protein VYE77_01440 [Planctomycetota bacterium]|nr:hypothetical protein [Planctomycetota bacterium]
MNPSRTLLIGSLLLGLPAVLAAQDVEQALRRQFDQLDANKDKVLTRKEFPGSNRQYEQIDGDGNGRATFAEYKESPVGRALVRSRYREAREPRRRTTGTELIPLRLRWTARLDKNRDGRISLAEWNGTPEGFAELDQDGNGLIDSRDRTEAAALGNPAPVLPETNRPMPDIDLLFKRFDKDKDGKLTQRELRSQKLLLESFDYADRDDDETLDYEELRLLGQAFERRRNPSSGTRPQPYEVPFAAWDKDDDGKVRQNEWQGPRSMFDQMDLDRDAAVSKEEVARYRKRVTGDNFVERFDLDDDGKVTLEEFAGPPSVFRRADRNGDGVVTKSDR